MNLKEIENRINKLEVDVLSMVEAWSDEHEPSRQDKERWLHHRYYIDLPETEERLNDFKFEFDSNYKRERRAEYLNELCEPFYNYINELEELKKRHGGLFCLDKELLQAKQSFKRHYLEYGVVKAGEKVEGYSSTEIDRCRQVPIDRLAPGQAFEAGHGRKRMLCPFHEERTGSFFIFADNSYHCFGCNEHGNNAIDFMIKRKDWGFREAVNYLSRF